jgi:uncharacterized protein YraI
MVFAGGAPYAKVMGSYGFDYGRYIATRMEVRRHLITDRKKIKQSIHWLKRSHKAP